MPASFDHEVCKPFYHKGSDNGILLLHGFTDCAAHMRKLADVLAQRGYTVRTINLPGHVTSEEDMAKTNWQQWLHAAKEAALQMRNELSTFTVGGLSMGGVLALLIAQQMKVDGCVTLAAPTAAQNPLLPLSGIAAPFVKRIAWKANDDRRSGLDHTYDYGYSGFPTAKAADLYRLIRMARSNLFCIHCPILAVQGDADQTISKTSADDILLGVSSTVRQKLWLPGVPHVCTLSDQLPAIADAVDGLMQRAQLEKEA